RRRRLTPKRLRKLVPRHRPAALSHQIREQQPALPSGEARLVDHPPVGLQRHTTQQRNPWLQDPGHLVAQILPRSGPAFLAPPRGIVNKVLQLRCDCGFEARAADEEGLVAEVQRYARDAHGMALTHDEALVLAFRVELNANTSAATPHYTAREQEEER